MTHDDMPCGFESYENDWLEVKYATPEQMQEEQKQENVGQKVFSKLKQKFAVKRTKNKEVYSGKKGFSLVKKCLKPVGVCAIIALLVAGMFFIDGGFVGDVFSYAKDTVTSNSIDEGAKTTLALPANATVEVTGSDVTLTGGSLAVNFVKGTVSNVTESSVTVFADNGLQLVYSNLSEVLVAKDDVVSQYHVLGKYDQSAVVSLLQDGQKITGMTADGYTLSW